MGKLNVAVIFGGVSSEHEISKLSANTIINNMSPQKYNVIPVYITQSGKWLMYDGCMENLCNIDFEKYGTTAFLSPDKSHKGLVRIVANNVSFIPVDIYFPVLHGSNGEDGTIQGLFALSNVKYVGCNLISSAIAMDKCMTKKIVSTLGIPQAKYLIYKKFELINDLIADEAENSFGYPCFVKPSNAGSSYGISKACNKEELLIAIDTAFKFDTKILIEETITGSELECAILGDGSNTTRASSIGEILPSNDFYDYEAKYDNHDSKTIINPNIDETIKQEIKNLSLKIFKALDCSGLSRVDFFLQDDTKKIIFNEINTLPGFTSISMYPMLWQEEGINLPSLIDTLIEIGLNR
jgi:D-alanine-D-alanine ligase